MEAEKIAQDQRNTKYRPLKTGELRALFQHHQFLSSGGKFGKQLGVDGQTYDFSRCRLDGADLSLAELNMADFTGASLRGVWLVASGLVGAVMVGADVSGGRFDYARMFGANLRDSRRVGTRFEGVDPKSVAWTKEEADSFFSRGPNTDDDESHSSEPKESAQAPDWDAWRRVRFAAESTP